MCYVQRLFVLVLCFAFCLPLGVPVVRADDVPAAPGSSTDFPKGQRYTVNGLTIQGYTFEEYKHLLVLEQQFKIIAEENKELEVQRNNFRLISDKLRISLQDTESQVVTLTLDRDRLFKKWEEENRKRLLAENKPAIGSTIAWVFAGTFAATTLGLVLGLVLSR